MAAEYNGEYQYSGEHVLQLMVKPMEKVLLPEGITVFTTKDNKKNLSYLGIADDNIYKYRKGFIGGDSGVLVPVSIACEKFKKELNIDLDKFLDTALRKALANNPGFDVDDLEGSDLEEAELAIFLESTLRGMVKNFWLGDKDKVHTAAGRYVADNPATAYAIGDDDERYNNIDGVWKQIENSQTATGNEVVVLHEIAQIHLNDDGTLVDDAALVYLKKAHRSANRILKSIPKSELRFYMTQAFMENYEDSISSATGTDGSRTALVDGIVRMTYKGIPIVPMPIETTLEDDFANAKPHRMILSTPGNLFMLFGLGSNVDARIWTNLDEEERRARLNFEWNAGYIHPQLITAVWGEYED
jgi:hypothetical protein